jgi:hypothetical protein
MSSNDTSILSATGDLTVESHNLSDLVEINETDGEFDVNPYKTRPGSSSSNSSYLYVPWCAADVASSELEVPHEPLPIGLCEDEMLDVLNVLIDELRALPPLERDCFVVISEPIIPLDLTCDSEELDAIIESSTGIRSRGNRGAASSARSTPQSRLWQQALRTTHTKRGGRTASRI